MCSRSCAGGQQSRKVQCVQKKPFQKEEAVLHSLCPVSTPTQVQACNSRACPPEWSLGPWSQVRLGVMSLVPSGSRMVAKMGVASWLPTRPSALCAFPGVTRSARDEAVRLVSVCVMFVCPAGREARPHSSVFLRSLGRRAWGPLGLDSRAQLEGM